MPRRCEDCFLHKPDVQLCQGDLMLCFACEKIRWPGALRITLKRRANKNSHNHANTNKNKEKVAARAPLSHDCAKTTSTAMINKQLSIEQAASAILSAQIENANKLDLAELSSLKSRPNDNLANIHTALSAIAPGIDSVEIANRALPLHNQVKDHIARRIDELSTEQVSLSQGILLTTTPMKTSSVPDSQISPILTTVTPRVIFPPAPNLDSFYQATASAINCTTRTCQVDRVEKAGKIVECSLCQTRYHKQCVGVKPTSKPACWICVCCKDIPNLIKSLMLKSDSQEKDIKDLRTENETLTNIIHEQRTVIEKIQQRNSSVDSINKENDIFVASSQGQNKDDKKTTLLIGDSILRDVNEKGLENTKVKCVRGAKVADIRDQLSGGILDSVDTVIMHVGTNNCNSDENTLSGIQEYETLVSELNTRAPTVKKVLSTICPRTDTHDTRAKQFNNEIRRIAGANNCDLVDNDETFRPQGYVDRNTVDRRGLHLSKEGTSRLLSNIHNGHNIIKPRHKPEHSQSRQSYTRNDTRQTRHFNQRPRNSRPRKCHYCGEDNHMKNQCKHGRPIQCFTCKGVGHKAHMVEMCPAQ